MSDPFLDRFFVQHRSRMYRAALRILGDGDAAMDIAQEAFLELHERPQIATSEQALGWVLRVVRNRSLDRLRARSRERERTEVFDERTLPANQLDPSLELVRDETTARLWTSLALISERQRQVILLRTVDGLRFPAIAASLGISEGAAKVHFRRGMSTLTRRIGSDPHLESDS